MFWWNNTYCCVVVAVLPARRPDVTQILQNHFIGRTTNQIVKYMKMNPKVMNLDHKVYLLFAPFFDSVYGFVEKEKDGGN